MGACNFIVFKAAPSAQEAFDALVEQATWEHGHDPYNGTISTTSLKRGYKSVAAHDEPFGKEVVDRAYKEAEDADWGEKRESRALFCGVMDDGTPAWAFYGWAAC